jgi:hypothetical protein
MKLEKTAGYYIPSVRGFCHSHSIGWYIISASSKIKINEKRCKVLEITFHQFLKLCIHIDISYTFIISSVATPKHSGLLPLEKYVYIAALAPDLRKVSVYSAMKFLYSLLSSFYHS